MKIQTTRIYAEIQKAKDAGFTTVSEQGSSRCFAKGTLIRMYDGKLKPVEDIVIGDKVMHIDGFGFNTVIDTHKGVDELYKVKQKRGIDYVVNSNHILSLRQTRAKQYKVAIPGFKSCEKRRLEMLPYDRNVIHDFPVLDYARKSKNERKRYTGFKNTLIHLEEKELPIDPYYLGIWLGDGTSIQPHSISNCDAGVIEYFYSFAKALGSYAYQVNEVTHRIQICEEGKKNTALKRKTRELRDSFRALNLVNNKHIPDIYIYNSYSNRLKLLAGLLDTDGCLSKRNTIVLTQKNRRIIEAVQEICRLSGFYTNGYREEKATMKRADGTVYKAIVYSIEINHNNFDDLNRYMRVERKKVKDKSCSRDFFASSVEVSPLGRGEYYGFELDNSPYFLLEDGTVCHNSSKTYNTVMWIILRCLHFPKTTVSVVRATLPAIKGSVFRDFKEIMIRMKVWNDKHMNKSELIYSFPNGSWIEFFSCDNEQKIRGRKRKILYVNEGNELKFIEWQQLQMRTTEFSIIDYNPSFTDDHWLCTLNKEQGTYHFITTYKDNPFLEQKVIDEIESLQWKNPSLWRVYGLGLQAIVEGLIFENVEQVDEIPFYAKKKAWLGIDLGYTNDATAIVQVCLYDDTIYVDEVCYLTKMLSSDIIDTIKNRNRVDKREYKVISESADPRMIDEIYNAGIDIHPVHKFSGSIMAGIQKMQEFKIKVTKRSTNVIKEFKNYTYRQDKEGKWLNEPIDGWNHAVDAIRYIILEEVLGGYGQGLSAEELADIL